MKFYSYDRCGTCKKALKFLQQNGIECQPIDIVSKPPSKKELKSMLSYYPVKKLFNTSGQLYRQMSIKDKLPDLTQDDALDLLAKNGKLIKRPFVLGDGFGLIGFKDVEWQQVFDS